MFRYFLSKLASFIATFFGVTLICFLFIRLLPGDPVLTIAGESNMSSPGSAGLVHQYWNYLIRLLHGDLGESLITKEPVREVFFKLLPATLELSLCASFLALILGIPMGIIAAIYQGKYLDRMFMSTTLVGCSLPVFWWGLMLILVFAGTFGWIPGVGRIDQSYSFATPTGFMLYDSFVSGQDGAFLSALQHLILPVTALATVPLAIMCRQTRSVMLDVLNEDYIRTAWAKGLSPFRINYVHALRNALIPIVKTVGLSVGAFLGGVILTETVFSWPGIGKWMIDSLLQSDYLVLQGGVLLISVIVMVVKLCADLLYASINPKIRK